MFFVTHCTCGTQMADPSIRVEWTCLDEQLSSFTNVVISVGCVTHRIAMRSQSPIYTAGAFYSQHISREVSVSLLSRVQAKGVADICTQPAGQLSHVLLPCPSTARPSLRSVVTRKCIKIRHVRDGVTFKDVCHRPLPFAYARQRIRATANRTGAIAQRRPQLWHSYLLQVSDLLHLQFQLFQHVSCAPSCRPTVFGFGIITDSDQYSST